jgi:HPt (histidine-containing phosphotransfer) domain-containing protein
VGDVRTARRLAHDLKSSAGTLGAQAVSEAAETLELACLNGSVPADMDALLSTLTRELGPVIAGLNSLEGPLR